MTFYVGKFLELAGLGLLAFALYAGIAEQSMARELTLLLVGACCFLAGLLIESRGAGGES